MGQPTGFLKFQREAPPNRPVAERLGDWQPLHMQLPDETLQMQAARCMDCGIPFCHKGHMLNGMTSGCPINNLIPEWNDLVYRGMWREAYQRLNRTNNFPEFTGLACPAPCEAACTLGISDPAVTIKSLEYAIIDRAFAEGWVAPEIPPRRTGKRVAIIGSGPAGLACADQLNKAGHAVTVFERSDRVGGLLMYGIPNMKLAKEMVARRVDLLRQAGIQFVTGTEVGADIAAADLVAEHDALVLCIGSTRPRDLAVDGRNLQGVHFAMEFLTANTRSLLDSGCALSGPLAAKGRDVIVIGGGDTGTDCVGTALRHGCRSLAQFEILPRPPQERAPDNPWPQWPRVYKLDYGQEEAAAVFGADPRRYQVLAKRVVGDDEGRVRAVHTVKVAWEKDPSTGRYRMHEMPDSEQIWPAQLVLLAMGFTGPEAPLLRQLGVEQDERALIRAAHGDYTTNVPGIFAAGDARRGQSLVVWAIHEGRGVARACDLFLMGHSDLP